MKMVPEHRWLLAGGRLAVALVLFSAGVALGQENPPPAADPAAAAEQPIICPSCGVEILPQAREYRDAGGNRICAGCAGAEEEPEPYNLWTTDRLTGDWGGARSALEDAGIAVDLTLGTVWQVNLRGGENTHNAEDTTGEGLWEIEFDFDTMFGLKGGTFFIAVVHTWHDGIVDEVGSLAEPYGGPGAPGGAQEIVIDKYHYRQRLFDDRLEFRLGMLDGGDLFDGNEYANDAGAQFPNAMLENNPTVPLPKGLGVFVRVWPAD